MERNIPNDFEQPTELGVASIATLGNGGIVPEKELTMLTGGISDE
jgi:hypothetical protein